MDRKKSYLKIVISFIFLPCIYEIMPRSSAVILKAFFKGPYGRKFAFKDPMGLQCVRERILCQHFFHSHFNRPFARWRHFTATTRILSVFHFISKFGNPRDQVWMTKVLICTRKRALEDSDSSKNDVLARTNSLYKS